MNEEEILYKIIRGGMVLLIVLTFPITLLMWSVGHITEQFADWWQDRQLRKIIGKEGQKNG